ncbi:MAG: response regulator transcription factor [Gemmatimonadales bacterium]|nr:response regulator transcription factor [Gemmatimonadales bacterium]MDZ4389612.1 response regulator transcription factor [Gemmatimonadales bacterium]
MTTAITLVLIDDNRLLREGLTSLLREQPGFRVLAASADVDEAMQSIRDAKPTVVLVDFSLENFDSLRVTGTIRLEVPEAKVIVMGLLATQEDVADFVTAGAAGFIMKDATLDEFLDTVRTVSDGGQVLPMQLTRTLFSQIAEIAVRRGKPREMESIGLTQRERQVIDLISDGLSNKEIAARLHIAVHTVKSHVHNVLEKLALHTRLEVAAFTRGLPRHSSNSPAVPDPTD